VPGIKYFLTHPSIIPKLHGHIKMLMKFSARNIFRQCFSEYKILSVTRKPRNLFPLMNCYSHLPVNNLELTVGYFSMRCITTMTAGSLSSSIQNKSSYCKEVIRLLVLTVFSLCPSSSSGVQFSKGKKIDNPYNCYTGINNFL